MKIGLLVSESGLYSHKRLKEEAEKKGHKFRIINLAECFVNITNDTPTIYDKKGKPIKDLDAVIPRIEPSITFFGTAILRQFEMLGVYPLNNSLAVLRARDKLRSLQILAKNNIPMPSTGIANSPASIDAIIKSLGGALLIIKLVEGTEGEGVDILRSNRGSLVLEINSSPGLEGIEKATGKNITALMIEHIEKHAKPYNKKHTA